MIKPFYFPNIYIAKDVTDVLKCYFEQISVYGVSAPNITNHTLKNDMVFFDIVIPDFNDEDQFNEFLLTGFNSKPLYDPNRAFELTSELQRRAEGSSTEDDSSLSEHYRVMRARVFLQMAYEYDVQSNLIQQDLQECKKREQELIKELQGFEETHLQLSGGDIDEKVQGYSSDYQIEKRFESWIAIFNKSLEEDDKSGHGFYITDSNSLIDTIIEFEPELERLCTIQPGVIGKEELASLISQLIECDWKNDKEHFTEQYTSEKDIDTDKLTLYILPEKEPCGFFEKFASDKKRGETLFEHRKSIRNTVIGYIDI